MEKVVLKGKLFIIRSLSQGDLKRPEIFLAYINSLIFDQEAMISFSEEKTIEEESAWLVNMLSQVNSSRARIFIAETDGLIVGEAAVCLCPERRQHVAELGVSLIRGYRGYGLGKYLLQKVIDIAKDELVPCPKMIRVSVFSSNDVAISFYQKCGFRAVASIPGQFEFGGRSIDEIVMLKFV